jgi:hypothetical protein
MDPTKQPRRKQRGQEHRSDVTLDYPLGVLQAVALMQVHADGCCCHNEDITINALEPAAIASNMVGLRAG